MFVFSRTQEFYKDYSKSLNSSDINIVSPIFAAREKPIKGVTSNLIIEELKQLGHVNTYYLENLEKLNQLLDTIVNQDDIVLTMGAGNIWRYNEKYNQHINAKNIF